MRHLATALITAIAVSSAPACSKERSESIELINEGINHESRGSMELAYSNYMRAATIDPENHRAFFHLAQIELYDRNEPDKGIANLARAAEIAPDDRDVLYHLGRYYATLDTPDTDKAVAWLDAALKVDPNHAPTHYFRGIALLAKDDFRGADLAFREAIACDHTYGMAYRDLGLLYERFDADEAAMRVYEAGAQQATEKTDVLNNFGLLLMRAGRVTDAVATFDKALRSGGARHDTVFNLAFAHMENGDPRAAFQYLAEFINRADVSQGEHIKVAILLKDAMEREIDRRRALENPPGE